VVLDFSQTKSDTAHAKQAVKPALVVA
jgi:hypothetical protein